MSVQKDGNYPDGIIAIKKIPSKVKLGKYIGLLLTLKEIESI